MPRGSANQNGGILGKVNKTSFGKNKITSTTSTGNFTTQPGTTVLNVAVVGAGAGGGAGGTRGGGGGGAGGFQSSNCISVCGNTAYPVTIGGGGAGANSDGKGTDGGNTVGFCLTSPGGGAGGGQGSLPGNSGASGGGSSPDTSTVPFSTKCSIGLPSLSDKILSSKLTAITDS